MRLASEVKNRVLGDSNCRTMRDACFENETEAVGVEAKESPVKGPVMGGTKDNAVSGVIRALIVLLTDVSRIE